jgi:hypothetical protein
MAGTLRRMLQLVNRLFNYGQMDYRVAAVPHGLGLAMPTIAELAFLGIVTHKSYS